MRSSITAAVLIKALCYIVVPVAADVLATVTPCPACPSGVAPAPITVTEQLQEVSTCTASMSYATGTSSSEITVYPCSTYPYLSTVLPCVGTSCTITATDEVVTFSHVSSAYTFYTPAPTTSSRGNLTATANIAARQVAPSAISEIEVIVVDYMAPYNQIGPLAISNYAGSGLCTACTPGSNGTLVQVVDVRVCVNDSCSEHVESWIAMPTTSTVPRFRPSPHLRLPQPMAPIQ